MVVVRTLACVHLLAFGLSFNIDINHPVVFNGPGLADSYFGYTVLEHTNDQGQWVLVGAPRDNSSYQTGLNQPGALYKCSVLSPHGCQQVFIDNTDNERDTEGEYFEDIKDGQWLGVSLTRQQRVNGDTKISTSEENSSTFPQMPTTAWRCDTNLRGYILVKRETQRNMVLSRVIDPGVIQIYYRF
uniref:Integrin alpha-9-like n=1 Tax=Saccoglossus kowalevskii TaxID=10224 RepID=A0ABM0MPG7_SACKO|nr:PREDICTED: integrin alpha-9-like [Saccoglossus kowalevskii]